MNKKIGTVGFSLISSPQIAHTTTTDTEMLNMKGMTCTGILLWAQILPCK